MSFQKDTTHFWLFIYSVFPKTGNTIWNILSHTFPLGESSGSYHPNNWPRTNLLTLCFSALFIKVNIISTCEAVWKSKWDHIQETAWKTMGGGNEEPAPRCKVPGLPTHHAGSNPYELDFSSLSRQTSLMFFLFMTSSLHQAVLTFIFLRK